MFHLAVSKRRPALLSSARATVISCMLDAWDRCRQLGPEPQEPDFVASLVLEGAPRLEREWNQALSREGIRIAVAGVFCHQTPKVRYHGMRRKSCEIGDLLWCHVHTNRQGDMTYNALLLQAKVSSDQPVRLFSRELDQLTLYARWPEFTYTKSGNLTGENRHVTPSAPRLGAQYLVMDSRPPENPLAGMQGYPGTYPIGVCIAANPLHDHADLGLELVNTLSLRSGSPFDDRTTAMKGTGWSHVIWDLLQMAAAKLFSRRRSGRVGVPRLAGASLEDLDGASYMNDNAPPRFLGQLRELEPSDEGVGVSSLLVETNEAEG